MSCVHSFPLEKAASSVNLSKVPLLLKYRADAAKVNRQSGQYTALHAALWDRSVIEEAGTKQDEKINELMEKIRLLVKNKANMNAIASLGRTPSDIYNDSVAKHGPILGYEKVGKLLKELCAKPGPGLSSST